MLSMNIDWVMKEHHISDCIFEYIRRYSRDVHSYRDVHKTKVFCYVSRGLCTKRTFHKKGARTLADYFYIKHFSFCLGIRGSGYLSLIKKKTLAVEMSAKKYNSKHDDKNRLTKDMIFFYAQQVWSEKIQAIL